jgi:hypothetical protein
MQEQTEELLEPKKNLTLSNRQSLTDACFSPSPEEFTSYYFSHHSCVVGGKNSIALIDTVDGTAHSFT